MKKFYVFLLLLLLSSALTAQSLVQTVPLPINTYYNSGYGLVYANGLYYISSGSSTSGKGIFYGVDGTGAQVDTIDIDYAVMSYSQGLAFDGTYFWYLERRSSKHGLFKVDMNGTVYDSIVTPFTGKYLGGAAWDGSGIWVSYYYPNDQAALYKVDLNTKTIIDTISVFGTQPSGITVKGDTLFYVMDGFEGDPENIYAVDLATEDTLFSFHVPENPGVRQNPRGLAWDGSYLWLLAEPLNSSTGRTLFKYDLGGSGSPGIDLLTTNINFGNVQIDSTSIAYIQILNYGNANLIIDSVLVGSTALQLEGVFPMTIKPDSMKTLTLRFTPTANIEYNDSILFYHNDPNFVYSKTTVKGKGVYTAPFVAFSPTSISFGDRRINSTSYEVLTVINNGSAPLLIDSLTTTQYNFYFDKLVFPITVDSISSKNFNVWFRPDEYKPYSDTLTVYSNASNANIVKLLLSGNVAAFDSTLGTKVWAGLVPDNPRTNYDDFTVRALKGMDDINFDGVNDVVVAADNYIVAAFNGNSSVTGSVLWTFNTHNGSNNTGSVDYPWMLQTADMNGDGTKDVVIGTGGGNEYVYVIDGFTGQKIWEFGDSVNYSNGDIMGLDVKRDRNGDGVPEVLAAASGDENGNGRYSVYMLDGRTGAQIWRIDQSAQNKFKYMVASNDIGGAFGTRTSSAYEVVGFDSTGTILWSFPTTYTPWTVYEIEDIGGEPASDVIAGDIGGYVYALSSDAGVLLWQKRIGNVFIEDMRIVPDINDSGTDDIFISGIASACYLLEGSTGETIWTKTVNGNILGIGVLNDMTGDNLPEFGVADLNKEVNIFEARAGNNIFNYAFTGSGNAAEMVESFGDVDGNGSWEFVAGSRNGEVVAFSGGTDIVVGIKDDYFTTVPDQFELQQNYPNPFNPATAIRYSVPSNGRVQIVVYDLLGRAVKTLVNEVKDKGRYEVLWDGTNNFNSKVSTGVYFYRMETENFTSTKKMILMK